MKLLQIDSLTRGNHCFLSPEDDCYYFMSCYGQEPVDNSIEKSFIYNLKKKPSSAEQRGYHHKNRVINEAARIVRTGLIQKLKAPDSVCIIPVPPSKIEGHPDYDDRLLRVLTGANEDNTTLICPVLKCIESIVASHESKKNRPTIAQLEANLTFDNALVDNVRPNIILFDDVLTTGAHFIACKEFLKRKFPHANIVGVFIARWDFAEIV